MSSVLRPVRKHKKGRTLGSVEIIRREDYADLELDAKVELIRSLVPLGITISGEKRFLGFVETKRSATTLPTVSTFLRNSSLTNFSTSSSVVLRRRRASSNTLSV